MSFERPAPVRPKRHGRSVVLARATTDLEDKAGDVSEQTGAGRSLQEVREFRSVVWGYWEREGRHGLPWRKTHDPYRILVSEVMLQQTQVDRVMPKYHEFLKAFPNVRALANAPLAHVLRVWSGLGYNRRAKYLHDAAKVICRDFGGNMRKALAHPLPGVGPYTKAAVRVFAFNEPHTMLETNIRTAFMHHFVSDDRKGVRDADIVPLIEAAAEEQNPRTWHWALMDYGVHLKRIGVRTNHQSVHYAKQSKFEGSLRQVRGAILRALHQGPRTLRALMIELRSQSLGRALQGLERDGLVVKEKGKWRIA